MILYIILYEKKYVIIALYYITLYYLVIHKQNYMYDELYIYIRHTQTQ